MKRQILLSFFLALMILNNYSFGQIEPFLVRTHTNTTIASAAMPYRLSIPVGFVLSKTYPLVLFLHGAGERGIDNNLQLTANRGATIWAETVNQNTYPCFVLAPQCALNKQWVNTPWAKGSYIQNNIPISDQLAMAVDILDSLQREFKIDISKIYVTGLSMGGYGTWDLITRFPTKFAAAIPICGAGDPSKASRIIALPLRVFASSDDGTVPVAGSRDMVNAINALGSNDRTEFYTEYTDQGHKSWIKGYNTTNLVSWLFTSRPIIYTLTDLINQTVSNKIYAQNGKIVSDFSAVSGEVEVCIFDAKGSMINLTISKGSEILKIDVNKKGVYIVRVQSGNKQYFQKVVL